MGPFEPDEKIADIIRKIRSVQPPETFTEDVMKRLPDRYTGLQPTTSFLNRLFSRGKLMWGRNLSFDPATHECPYCFFITGYFYLIMGIVLMAGFKAIGPSMSTMDWIKLQPHLTIGAAIWLLALGMVSLINGSTAIKIAKYGTWFYIFFTVFNGILMWDYLHLPYAGVPLISFEAMSVLMGVMLAFAVKKMELGLQ